MDLFDLNANSARAMPLAERMRPRELSEFIGQKHLLHKGSLLMRAIQADKLGSCIFFGPPGTGKTTLAGIIANSTSSEFVKLNAVSSGVAEAKKRRSGCAFLTSVLFYCWTSVTVGVRRSPIACCPR